ncbi:MAG: sodium/solute symporter [Bacteroidaceae bacterium]|nr:sodium/solute symporter [Bacteroidaceae bacterium]
MNTQISLTEALSQSGLESIDYVILFTYLIMLVSLGVFLSFNRETKNTNDYFLAGNTLTWWAVGASLIAANISAEQLIGMAGTAYADGIAIAAYEIMAAIALLLIGKFLLPIMMEQRIFTMPQFLRKRYNSGVGLAFSILWLFLYIFINLTTVAWLGALAIEQIMGLQGLIIEMGFFHISARIIIIIALFAIAGLYSIHGGMTSVAWTDVMQVVFIIGGGLATAYYALGAVAGDDGSISEGFQKLCNFAIDREYAKDAHFHLIIQESHNASAYDNVPGIAAIVGGLWLTNLCYWGFNQYITQKGLAAYSIHEAQKGFLFAGMLKILMPFIVLIPGICAFYITQYGDTNLQDAIKVSDEAYPWFIKNFMPTGIKGLAFVALAAAVISSLASMLNSTSTIFTIDIYRKYINPEASDKKLVVMGRTSAILALIIALVSAAPLLGELDQAFQYIQEYSGFLYPGIAIVFGLGLLWKRASGTAAIWTTILTIPLGILFKFIFPNVPFQFRAGYVFMILLILFVTISLNSKKVIPSQSILKAAHDLMKRWGYIMGGVAIASVVAATIVSCSMLLLPSDATPENNILAYLNDIGFQAFYFFGFLAGACALLCLSNARSPYQDPKALPINIALFSTTRGYTYGALSVCIVSLIIYIILW